jgi:hypothetical protein
MSFRSWGFSESEKKLEFMASEDNTRSEFIMLAYWSLV